MIGDVEILMNSGQFIEMVKQLSLNNQHETKKNCYIIHI